MPESPETLTPQQILRKRKFGEPVFSGDEEQAHRHLIVLRLANSIGALNRVINLFSQRGFKLESVAIGETDNPGIARMTLATRGNDRTIAQVIRQLEGLVDTLDVKDLTHEEHVERELCLVRIQYTTASRAELMDTLGIFRGKVVDVTPSTMTFELTGPTKKINAFVDMIEPHGIVEIARNGRVAMQRDLYDDQ